LTGLVASKFNNQTTGESKPTLTHYVEKNHLMKKISPTPKSIEKFNLFENRHLREMYCKIKATLWVNNNWGSCGTMSTVIHQTQFILSTKSESNFIPKISIMHFLKVLIGRRWINQRYLWIVAKNALD